MALVFLFGVHMANDLALVISRVLDQVADVILLAYYSAAAPGEPYLFQGALEIFYSLCVLVAYGFVLKNEKKLEETVNMAMGRDEGYWNDFFKGLFKDLQERIEDSTNMRNVILRIIQLAIAGLLTCVAMISLFADAALFLSKKREGSLAPVQS